MSSLRKNERVSFFRKANWDFFSSGTGRKDGYIANISRTGCLLKTSEIIDHRRWLRVVVRDDNANLWLSLVGRTIRCENSIEAMSESEVTLFRYGVEFTYPGPIAAQDFDLILALSSKNLTVRSCRNLNSKSSFLPGFLA
jgi:hypothetical protein